MYLTVHLLELAVSCLTEIGHLALCPVTSLGYLALSWLSGLSSGTSVLQEFGGNTRSAGRFSWKHKIPVWIFVETQNFQSTFSWKHKIRNHTWRKHKKRRAVC